MTTVTVTTRRAESAGEIEQLQTQMGQLIRSFLRDPFAGPTGDRSPV
jgi:hypothetical protein